MNYCFLDDLFDEKGWKPIDHLFDKNDQLKSPAPSKFRPAKEGYENLSVGIQANNITADSITVKEGITVQEVPVVTENELDELKKELKNQKTFLDLQTDAFAYLMKDKIEEEVNALEESVKRAEKKEKKANIDRFIDTIKATYFVPHQGLTKVIWKDGTKTEVRCQDGDEYNPEAGLALCIIKYLFGNTNYYNEIFKSVFEKNSSVKEDPPVKKKKALPKKKKRFPSQEKTDFEW